MADDERPESLLAAAARRMREESERQAPVQPAPQAAPRPAYVPPAQPQPAAAAPSPPGWGGYAWTPPAAETRGHAPAPSPLYPPPGAAASAGEPEYSPWWRRVVATLIDTVVIGVPGLLLFLVAGGASGFQTDAATGQTTFHRTGALTAVWLLSLVGSLAYFIVLEGGRGGATVGKMAMGIQVRSVGDLGPIGYGRALGRRVVADLLWWLLFVPGLLDVLWPLWDSRRQTLHDKALDTVVVRKGY